MNNEGNNIEAICSSQGEVVKLASPVNINCPIEVCIVCYYWSFSQYSKINNKILVIIDFPML